MEWKPPEKAQLKGITGKISFNQHGDLLKPTFTLYQVRGAKWVQVTNAKPKLSLSA
ncbi:hypothetical protein PSAC2689_180033 [Paraburkholderia sacchari]